MINPPYKINYVLNPEEENDSRHTGFNIISLTKNIHWKQLRNVHREITSVKFFRKVHLMQSGCLKNTLKKLIPKKY